MFPNSYYTRFHHLKPEVIGSLHITCYPFLYFPELINGNTKVFIMGLMHGFNAQSEKLWGGKRLQCILLRLKQRFPEEWKA